MHKFRFGLEEEYFVVDRRTGGIKSNLPKEFMLCAKKKLGPNVMYELLQSQIEVATDPVASPADARSQLRHFRSTLKELGQRCNVGIVAAGSHPLALPHEQRVTNKRRYAQIIDDLGMVGLANPLCGLHVHVEVPDPNLRVDLMYQLAPLLPLLLALSTSSPFWSACDTGLLGYRNAANDMMPRSGFPEMFESLSDYESYVSALVEAKIIPDSTYIWWALRPSLKHPTLELRICDCCTSIADAVAIGSLYRAMVSNLVRRPRSNNQTAVSRALAEENKWRAQRYGIDGTFIDERTRKTVPFGVLLERVISELEEDIASLGIWPEIQHLRTIQARGTSAHQQLRLYRRLRSNGLPPKKSVRIVSKWLRECTEHGDFVKPNAYCGSLTPPVNGSRHQKSSGLLLRSGKRSLARSRLSRLRKGGRDKAALRMST
jgi:glutamate---cysteine ligase / carboxylate-amine ligase